jgi:hypothetical protein
MAALDAYDVGLQYEITFPDFRPELYTVGLTSYSNGPYHTPDAPKLDTYLLNQINGSTTCVQSGGVFANARTSMKVRKHGKETDFDVEIDLSGTPPPVFPLENEGRNIRIRCEPLKQSTPIRFLKTLPLPVSGSQPLLWDVEILDVNEVPVLPIVANSQLCARVLINGIICLLNYLPPDGTNPPTFTPITKGQIDQALIDAGANSMIKIKIKGSYLSQ